MPLPSIGELSGSAGVNRDRSRPAGASGDFFVDVAEDEIGEAVSRDVSNERPEAIPVAGAIMHDLEVSGCDWA